MGRKCIFCDFHSRRYIRKQKICQDFRYQEIIIFITHYFKRLTQKVSFCFFMRGEKFRRITTEN